VSDIELNVSSLSTGYPKRPVIRDITLGPIKAGEITALVGPNAAGKSTLLRALAGLLPATGEALLGGTSILQLSARARADRIGFMPQSALQSPGLTVLEGMLSALHVAGSSGQDPFVNQAVEVLAEVGIADIAHQPLNNLSGGQRQLASLAQAIVRRPSLLLLDEPTSALDLRHQFDVMSMVRAYVGEGRIAMVVLHDLTFAARWADRIIVMKNGAFHAAGSPDAAITPEMLASVYGVEARVQRCDRGFLQVIVDNRSSAN
jgi:ABC-type cobalamin/Fe3+-siderophores transport system ATPase subunit